MNDIDKLLESMSSELLGKTYINEGFKIEVGPKGWVVNTGKGLDKRPADLKSSDYKKLEAVKKFLRSPTAKKYYEQINKKSDKLFYDVIQNTFGQFEIRREDGKLLYITKKKKSK